ncbi:non-hydrolyzing UDP-N-acetylglucosamine 2-epimerase [Halopseudomonas bauzanensis]|uniref:non-hydrolyzing UDP-N-acetylglucosamine 2-epimerase n=1 Tax=Halopseudomonas bauzanensis TaxID=653930 RepID=UPI0035265E69
MKILTVIGARPQFIKAAAFSRALKKCAGDRMTEVVVHTGQHYDANMSDVFFAELDIPKPNYNLNIGGGSHGENTGRMLEKLEELLLKELPNVVLVYGDTDSTLAGALAAAKLNIPVAHVEAGLRSYNRAMPEEINRVLTDHISSILFTPTLNASNNLITEGVADFSIKLVGDVMYDAATFYASRAAKPDWFDRLTLSDFVLCTIHRAENTNDLGRLKEIIAALSNVNEDIILPIHPRTRNVISDAGIQFSSNVNLVKPVGYLEMTWLEANSLFIATDSGGVQKEAFFHKKQCVTFREETEWTELVEAGVNTLVGANKELIESAFETARRSSSPKNTAQLYGSGNAAELIVHELSLMA